MAHRGLRMPTKNCRDFLREEHNKISEYLELEFFTYLDQFDEGGFKDADEKNFFKKFIKVIKKFGMSQDNIGNSLEGDRSFISIKTERLNYFLKKFSECRIDPPIQVFYYHLTPEGQKKRVQCHLACSQGRELSTVNDSIIVYSADIFPFDQAKEACAGKLQESNIQEKSKKESQSASEPETFSTPSLIQPEATVRKHILEVGLLLKQHQISEAKELLQKLEPLNPLVIFHKQLAVLASKPIKKLSNHDIKTICKNLELLLDTDVKHSTAFILHAIKEKYHDTLGRRFPVPLPEKPAVEIIKDLPELELFDQVVIYE